MIKKYLLEDDESSFNKKAQRRAIDCRRVAKLAREAAKKAEENNQSELAASLNQKADELENAAKNWNKDSINSESSSSESSGNNENSNKNNSTVSTQIPDENNKTAQDTNSEGQPEENSSSNASSNNRDQENSKGNQEGSSTGKSSGGQSSQETNSNNDNQGSSEQEESDDTEGSSENDDDPVEDIFHTKQQSQTQASQQGQKEPRKPTLDEIIKQLSSLPEKKRQEAILGLKDLLGITND